jgi:4-alpha-glucanotransferase
MALDKSYGGHGKVWQDWPTALAQRKPRALGDAAVSLADECNFWRFCQWCFYSQWSALKDYANSRGIEIVGDMPIFVSPHSADVWANQHLFDLDDKGLPRVVAGVPPDYFSATGQHWGNPLYNWPAHEIEGYRWWIERMRTTNALCDIVRIDHFRGFESYWEIPADAETAVNGQWKKGPGAALFTALSNALGEQQDKKGALKIIAEDLGIITPEVTALREKIGLPGMRILQFAFDGHADNLYLPHNYDANTVVYTGTHDNDTTLGWWNSLAAHDQDYVRRYLGISGSSIQWDLIRTASASVASLSIIPMQDILGLDSAHRMNQPSVAEGSWEWRFSWSQVAPWHAEHLAELTRLHGRIPRRRIDMPTPANLSDAGHGFAYT